ncbi:hypothetical protein HDR61_03540 [bacterium]|nr:hypothetical protein [bacterium]
MKYLSATIAVLMLITPGAFARNYKHASDNSCWYETEYGKKSTGDNWGYYFCGPMAQKCDGKKHKGHDFAKSYMDMEMFTFKNKRTNEPNSFCCCGGTETTNGQFVAADSKSGNCFVGDPIEEKKPLGNNEFCTRRTYKTVCGGTYTVECNTPEPETCGTGYVWRDTTKSCAQICTDGQVFEEYTNKCISCETTAYQGIADEMPKLYCMKCDRDTQFFDRQTKTCVSKKSGNFMERQKMILQKCWQCATLADTTKCVTANGEPTDSSVKSSCQL